MAAAVVAHPAQALGFQGGGFRLGPLVGFGGGAVGLAEGVATGNEGDRLFVIHGHAAEGGADVLGCLHVVAAGVRPFGVDVDQPHVGGAKGCRELTIALDPIGVDPEPGYFITPVDVLIRLPHIRAATTKSEGSKAHGLQRDVAGEDQQIGPGDLVAVLLLDGPEQAAGLVDVDVVGPAVEGGEALLATTATATAIRDAIGACGVPGHADELGTVVTEVRRPPLLGVCHQLDQVFLECLVVEAVECLGIVEIFVHGIGAGGMLVQQIQPQLIRPPITIGSADAGGVVEGAFAFFTHLSLSLEGMYIADNLVWEDFHCAVWGHGRGSVCCCSGSYQLLLYFQYFALLCSEWVTKR
ncbi:hypothetical protein D3C78_429050 [compost metagenome]